MANRTATVKMPVWLLVLICAFIIVGILIVHTDGAEGAYPSADINNDGIVNFADLNILAAQFGETGDRSATLDGIYVLDGVRNSRGRISGYNGFLALHRAIYFIQIEYAGISATMRGRFTVDGDIITMEEGTAKQPFEFQVSPEGIRLRDQTGSLWIQFDFYRISSEMLKETVNKAPGD